MSRPKIEGTNYKVTIHKNGGYRYASTQPLLTDPKTGKTYNKRIHWGTVDDKLKFHPGKTYIYASPTETAKLVFPDDWDMSEAEALKTNRGAGRPKSSSTDENKLYGDVWLLERVAEKTGVREDLKIHWVEGEILILFGHSRRNAIYQMHRAQRQGKVHHAVCRQADRHCRDIWL